MFFGHLNDHPKWWCSGVLYYIHSAYFKKVYPIATKSLNSSHKEGGTTPALKTPIHLDFSTYYEWDLHLNKTIIHQCCSRQLKDAHKKIHALLHVNIKLINHFMWSICTSWEAMAHNKGSRSLFFCMSSHQGQANFYLQVLLLVLAIEASSLCSRATFLNLTFGDCLTADAKKQSEGF